MRGVLVLIGLAFLALPLSGCISDPPETNPETAPATVQDAPSPAPPENLSYEQAMLPSADPMIMVDGSICGPAAQCHTYPFTLQGNTSIEAILRWSLEVNDLDLHLVKPDGSVASAATLLPGRVEWMSLDLGAGDHTLVVTGFLVTQDTFHLDVGFA